MRMLNQMAVLAVLLTVAPTAKAASAQGQWFQGNNTAVRLIVSTKKGSGLVLAGVEIGLDPGWKTYWRNPGDAGGVPPSIDWSASENLEPGELLYPAPHRFSDGAGDGIGYKGSVLFPVRMQKKNPKKPARLVAQIMYGVCSDICIPVETKLDLDIPADGEEAAEVSSRLAAALASVPGPAVKGGAVAIDAPAVDLEGSVPAITIAVHYPKGAGARDLFVETLDQSFLPQPKQVSETGDETTFSIGLSKFKARESLKGKAIVFTAVSDKGAAESHVTLP